jgi:hypothetical protein
MLYAAKCYRPGVTAAALEQVAGHLPGSLLFAADDLVLRHGPAMRPPRPAALTFPPRDFD